MLMIGNVGGMQSSNFITSVANLTLFPISIKLILLITDDKKRSNDKK